MSQTRTHNQKRNMLPNKMTLQIPKQHTSYIRLEQQTFDMCDCGLSKQARNNPTHFTSMNTKWGIGRNIHTNHPLLSIRIRFNAHSIRLIFWMPFPKSISNQPKTLPAQHNDPILDCLDTLLNIYHPKIHRKGLMCFWGLVKRVVEIGSAHWGGGGKAQLELEARCAIGDVQMCVCVSIGK